MSIRGPNCIYPIFAPARITLPPFDGGRGCTQQRPQATQRVPGSRSGTSRGRRRDGAVGTFHNMILPRAGYISDLCGHVGAARAPRDGAFTTSEKIEKIENMRGRGQRTVVYAGSRGSRAGRGHDVHPPPSGEPPMTQPWSQIGDPRPCGRAFGSFPKLIRGGKDARSCGSIVEGSAAPTYYDSGPVDAKGSIWTSLTTRASTSTPSVILVSSRGPTAGLHIKPSPRRRTAPNTDGKTVPSTVAAPRAAPPKPTLLRVGSRLRSLL